MKSIHSKALHNGRQGERGVALVITLLLLVLMIALTLAMVIATSSDTLINHYYRNFRSSFYAADSGLNIARQTMANQLLTALAGSSVSLSATPPSLPLAVGTENTVQTAISNAYGGGYTSINSGQASSSWPGKFEITSVCLQSACGVASVPTCQVEMSTGSNPSNAAVLSGPCSTIVLPTFSAGAPPTCAQGAANCGSITAINYLYPYTMTAVGQSMANEQVTLQDSGYLSVNVTVGSAGQQLSFAAFGTFLDHYPGYPNCGDPFAGGTLTGKIYTNDGWTWGLGQNYTFAGQVGSVSPNFFWNYGNTGSCDSNANLSDKQGGNSITPTWDVQPPQLGITKVPLPPNDYNQKEAVVDGKGNSWSTTNSSGVTTSISTSQQDTDMSQSLLTVNGTYTPYPSTGTTTPGVYLAYTSTTKNGVTTNTMTGGGIYVEGEANSVVLSTANPTINGTVHSQQLYTITQGNTTTTVTVDLTSNTTTTSQAVTTTSGPWWNQTSTTTTTNTTISGVPENLGGASPSPATMLYVDGNIDSLSGPSSGPAIQNASAVTITSADNITITGNITYTTEPVTLNSSDTLVPSGNTGQVLGIFTANPNGVIGFSVPNSGQNLEVDASMAAISSGGSGSVYNVGNAIGTVTWVGGRIANTTNNCNCNQRNIYFDQRFAQGFAPPWFPATTITATGPSSGTVSTVTIQRTQWVDQTAW
jgi:Tfp pilus assembly protein PilX